jgi:hypothetical protein
MHNAGLGKERIWTQGYVSIVPKVPKPPKFVNHISQWFLPWLVWFEFLSFSVKISPAFDAEGNSGNYQKVNQNKKSYGMREWEQEEMHNRGCLPTNLSRSHQYLNSALPLGWYPEEKFRGFSVRRTFCQTSPVPWILSYRLGTGGWVEGRNFFVAGGDWDEGQDVYILHKGKKWTSHVIPGLKAWALILS